MVDFIRILIVTKRHKIVSEILLRSCEYCGSTLPLYAYSFCPNCGTQVDQRKNRILSKFSKLPDGKHYSNLLAKLPRTLEPLESASGIIRNFANNIDMDIGKVPVMAAVNAVKDPKIAAVAKGIARKSPEIAQIIVGFTPLAPFSPVISGLLENATQQMDGQSKKISELQTSIFCSECGQKLMPTHKFCPRCGTKVS